MKKFSIAALVVLAVFLACNDFQTPTTPSAPQATTTVPMEKPRVDAPFSWDRYQGYIAFGLGHPGQTEEDVIAFAETMLGSGWNTPQVCSETEFWSGDGYPTKPRDEARLRATLDVLARIPGVQVALVGNCTLKRQVPLSEQFQWAETVARVASEYKNVAIFTHNEFDNCAGRGDWGGRAEWCAGKNEVAKHIQLYRGHGFAVVTADDSIGPRVRGDSESKSFSFRLANIGASPASFHPQREHRNLPWDPDVEFLRKIAQYNGDFVLSETVAWMDFSGRCDGLRTCDTQRIENYIANCAAVQECHFTLHGENLLMGEVPSWIPLAY